MILVDSSVWVDHFRRGDPALAGLLQTGQALAHPWAIGELAMGHLSPRQEILSLLHGLPSAQVAGPNEVLLLVERHQLMGRGIGFVDVQLLASSLLSGASLWTRDRRLLTAAQQLGCAVDPDVVTP